MSQVRSYTQPYTRLEAYSPVNNRRRGGLPSTGLLGKWLAPEMVDTIGLSIILYQSGDASTWQTTAVWGFGYDVTTAAIDTDLGGNKLFLGTAPIYRTWAEWMDQPWMNLTFLFMGIKGIAAYSTGQTASVSKITRYLNYVDVDTDEIPTELALLWNAADILDSRTGPDASFLSAGATPDGDGGVLAANVPAVHTIGGRKLMWNGPAYTNMMSAGSEDMQSGWGLSNHTAVEDGELDGHTAYLITTATGIAAYDKFGPVVSYVLGTAYNISFTIAKGSRNVYVMRGGAPAEYGTLSLDFTAGMLSATNGSKVIFLSSSLEMLSATVARVSYSLTSTESNVGTVITGINFNTTTVGETCRISKFKVVQSAYQFPYILPGTSVTSCAGTTGLNGPTWPMSGSAAADKLKACFAGVCTVAALVRMGVGSAELVPITTIRQISVNGSSQLYTQVFTGPSLNIVNGYDGTTYINNTSSWDHNEYHLKVVQVNAAGTQFRVGHRRYTSAMVPIDSAIVWGAWSAFDGSFDPLDTMITALNTTVPHWTGQVQVWNSEASEADILKWQNKYYPEVAA